MSRGFFLLAGQLVPLGVQLRVQRFQFPPGLFRLRALGGDPLPGRFRLLRQRFHFRLIFLGAPVQAVSLPDEGGEALPEHVQRAFPGFHVPDQGLLVLPFRRRQALQAGQKLLLLFPAQG